MFSSVKLGLGETLAQGATGVIVLPVDHPLLCHPHVLVTPHVASGTAAGRRRLYAHAIENALATLAGTPTSVVPEQA